METEGKIKAKDLAEAISVADGEMHGSEQACFDGLQDDLSDFLFDGRVNLVRVAEILNRQLENSAARNQPLTEEREPPEKRKSRLMSRRDTVKF